jgi:hypothetical protein
MYISLLIILACLFLLLSKRRHQSRSISENWLLNAYTIYNNQVYPFHNKISMDEQKYISMIMNNYDPEKEFKHTHHISPYSFGISIEKGSGKVNLSRFNIGSVEQDIRVHIEQLLQDINLDDSICAPGYKYYGVGWDLEDGIIKFYTINKHKSKIECHVYKVQRNRRNEVIEVIFKIKKIYDVGIDETIMYKDGKNIEQTNQSRSNRDITHNYTANNWIRKFRRLEFILDTVSEYDGKIILYFD